MDEGSSVIGVMEVGGEADGSVVIATLASQELITKNA